MEVNGGAGGDESNDVLWRPDPLIMTQMDRFRIDVNKKYAVNLENYKQLWQWSIDHYAEFWGEVWNFCQLLFSVSYMKVVDTSKNISEIPEWFEGARLNYAENLLKHDGNRVAVYSTGEGRLSCIRKITFAELRQQVARYAAAMKAAGVRIGDRVVGYLPNCPEAVEAMLAAASIGAVWSSTSPDFGVSGVLDRFTQIKPKLLFSVEAVIYNGKKHNHMDKLLAVVQGLPDVDQVIMIPFCGAQTDMDISTIPKSVFLSDFLNSGQMADHDPILTFEQLPFNHPLFVMYSSGTTGPPKCMVHSAGGTLIQHLKEHILHGNMTAADVMFYYTTVSLLTVILLRCGTDLISCFVGQNWTLPVIRGEVQGRNLGMAVESWDDNGNAQYGKSGELVCTKPFPSMPTHFWNDATGAKYKKAYFEKFKGVWSHGDFVLISARTGGLLMLGRSDGTLNPGGVRFGSAEIYHVVEEFSQIDDSLCVGQLNRSNQEERVVLFLKMKSGHTLTDSIMKQVKERICRLLSPRHVPAIVLPIADVPYTTNAKKVEVAVKQIISGVEVNNRGALANPEALELYKDIPQLRDWSTTGMCQRVRVDMYEACRGITLKCCVSLYQDVALRHTVHVAVEEFSQIDDSLCVGQLNRSNQEERVVLFLKMKSGHTLTASLVKQVKERICRLLSPRHVPAVVLPIADVPYTTNAKKVEVAVKQIISGVEVNNRGALANPEALELYKDIPQLRDWST
ncbi:PREDICTED: acetoacetyl-CoA synthetase-like [Priapulus caudatus]|uniref:Acetoacetyl-CoA synthetase-like n=1 Tax=Priapulus caudatus TaxID=37621 RepID=A0ABM1DY60_PRICU|nr:PREDICTED: acetoacetyl-CoA synthetase-like [Priapulus caudatus]